MEMYLLKFSACLLVFWLVYVLLLERQKMHQVKRFYLLGSFAAAIIIPLLTITYYIEPVVRTYETTPIYFPIEPEMIDNSIEETSLNIETILWYLYGLGVVLFSIRFIINLTQLFRRILSNEKVAKHSFVYVLLNTCSIPHSFFKYVFLNKKKFEDNTIPKEVLLHEETHAKQLHSLDIILLELLQIIFWFHPLVYILKHHIKLNHEFLADEAVLNQGTETKTYQNILLQFSSNTQEYQLSSAINYSSFKKRFTVMKTQTSKTRIWLSSLLLLPIIAILFYSFAEKEYIPKDNTEVVDAITNELNEAEKLNITYTDGATESMMKEYNDWIIAFNTSHKVDYKAYQRIVAIYEIMSETQRKSVERYPVIPSMNLSEVTPKSPTKAEFESWKNDKEYAIWINGKHVPNSALNNYNAEDIIHFVGSKVYKNARSQKFPQPFQFSLYTKEGFKTTYQESAINKYNKLSKTYAKAIKAYLKGPQTDNTELRLLSIQAENMYKSFSKEEIAKHKLLPPPPVPAQYSTPRNQNNSTKSNKSSKGGPNANSYKLNDIIEQQTPKTETGFININGQTLYYTKLNNDITYYNRYGVKTDKNGNKIVPEQQTNVNNVLPNATVSKTYQEAATKKQIEEYNIWAKKINTEINRAKKNKSYEYPIIKLKEVERYKYIYSIMTKAQRKNAEAFPNIPPPPKPVSIEVKQIPPPPPAIPENASPEKRLKMQKAIDNYEKKYKRKVHTAKLDKSGEHVSFIANDEVYDKKATKQQIEEYNKIAKTYNNVSKADMIVKLKDVKRLKYLYSLMSKAQRKSAQPFPDFPPPPKHKLLINNKKIVSHKLEMTIDDIKKLTLSLKKDEISTFKLKIPGIKTELIKGNTITTITLKNLESIRTGDTITLFDIKTKSDSKIDPVVIKVVK
jgi:hypothetical protein